MRDRLFAILFLAPWTVILGALALADFLLPSKRLARSLEKADEYEEAACE